MQIWEAILLGLLQGLTEFFPVSSTGVLVIGQELLGIRLPGITFEIVVHAATLLAVFLVYRRRIITVAVGAVRNEPEAWRYIGLLVVATIPLIVIGLFLRRAVVATFDNAWLTGVLLLVTGAMVFSTRWTVPRARKETIGWRDAAIVGLAQAVSTLPGISRSGATVATGLALGIEPRRMAEYSFILSIIAVSGATALELRSLSEISLAAGVGPLIAAFIAALLGGVFSIWFFVRLLETRQFHYFAYFTWPLGTIFLIYLMLSSS